MNTNTAPTFTVGGILKTTFRGDESFSPYVDFDVQSDGKLIVVGKAVGETEFSAIRYQLNGSIDPSFNQEDLSTLGTSLKLNARNSNLQAVQSDNKLLNASNWSGKLTRVNADGTPDNSFGNSGSISLANDLNVNSFWLKKIILLPNDKIGLIGYSESPQDFALVQLNTDGSINHGFGNNGAITADLSTYDQAFDAAFQDDGKVIMVGNINNRSIGLVRLNSDGTLDTSFGSDGKVNFKPFSDTSVGSEVKVQAIELLDNGQFLITGTSDLGNDDVMVAKFNNDGSLDASFGNGGVVTMDLGTVNKSNNDVGFDIKVLQDNKILVAAQGLGHIHFLRLNSNGSLDNSWAPSNTLQNIVTYTQEGFDTRLSHSAKIYDEELSQLNNTHGNFNGSSITISRHGTPHAEDQLYIVMGINTPLESGEILLEGKNIGTVSNQNGVLNILFNENADQQSVNKILQSIAYKNETDLGRLPNIKLDWVFNDGNTGSQGNGAALSALATTTVALRPADILPNLNQAPLGIHVVNGALEGTSAIYDFSSLILLISTNNISFKQLISNVSQYNFQITSDTNQLSALTIGNGDTINAYGSNLRQDTYTINKFVYTATNGVTATLTGALEWTNGGVVPTSSYSHYTIADNRPGFNITHNYIGQLDRDALGSLTSYEIIYQGNKLLMTGNLSLTDYGIGGVINSLKFTNAENHIEFSGFSLSTYNLIYRLKDYSTLLNTFLSKDNYIVGSAGNDTLEGYLGNDIIDGRSGTDTVIFKTNQSDISSVKATKKADAAIQTPEGIAKIINIEHISFLDGDTTLSALLTAHSNQSRPTFSATANGLPTSFTPVKYTGPVRFLEYELLGNSSDDIVVGAATNDFINLLGGDDAANGGEGDDVLDGGTGSNFLTGGGGDDTMFLDGRSGATTWSTITDFSSDEVNIWGWTDGFSKLLLSQDGGGAAGFTGATFHYDLNNDGNIDTSITFTGLSTEQAPSASAHIVADNGYLLMV